MTAMRTAGRAVLTAGATVVIGMLGLLVLRQSLLNGVAIAAAATVAMTVIASLTLLPALLSFTGTRLARASRLNTFLGGKVFTTRSGQKKHAAERWAGVVQRHPVLATVVSAAFILVLAAPALAMKLSMPDESAQARSTMASYSSEPTPAALAGCRTRMSRPSYRGLRHGPRLPPLLPEKNRKVHSHASAPSAGGRRPCKALGKSLRNPPCIHPGPTPQFRLCGVPAFVAP